MNSCTTTAGELIPSRIVMCRAANNGNGLRIRLDTAARREREKSHVCGDCAACAPCTAYHTELVRTAR